MPNTLAAFLLVYAVFLPGCAQDTPKSLANEMVDIMEDLADVLEGVADLQSAKDAGPKIQKIADRMEDNFARRRALGDPTEEERAEFESDFAARFEAVSDRMDRENARIESLGPEVLAELEAGMQALLEINTGQ